MSHQPRLSRKPFSPIYLLLKYLPSACVTMFYIKSCHLLLHILRGTVKLNIPPELRSHRCRWYRHHLPSLSRHLFAPWHKTSLAAGCHLPDYTKGSTRERPAPVAHMYTTNKPSISCPHIITAKTRISNVSPRPMPINLVVHPFTLLRLTLKSYHTRTTIT